MLAPVAAPGATRRRIAATIRNRMVIYLFRDESRSDVFAFSTDVTGQNIPPITPHTEWIFAEAIDTLNFVEPWDVGDFQDVLDHLKTDGYFLFEGELLEPRRLTKRRDSSREC
jgi:hypothetical protein